VTFFESGGQLKLRDDGPADEWLAELQKVPGLLGHLQPLGAAPDDPAPVRAAAAEFVLEGLWAQKKIGRTDDRGFVAAERPPDTEIDLERLERLRRMKKQVN
jgi:magnesium chelatase subunit I